MRRDHRGTALPVTLVLLTGLSVMALAAAAATAAALALSGWQLSARLAFEAAEAGIAEALGRAAHAADAWDSGQRPHPADSDGVSYRARVEPAPGPGTLPAGFSLDGYVAAHYVVTAEGRATRAARERLEQIYYVLRPAP